MKIPEDLQERYADLKKRNLHGVLSFGPEYVEMKLIERIAALEQECDQLRGMMAFWKSRARAERDNYAKDAAWARNHREKLDRLRAEMERLSAPVSDEESYQFALHAVDLVEPIRRVPAMLIDNVNAMLAARIAQEGK